MIKLIASDLDGTLLDNNGNIPKEFGNIIEVLNLKNIKYKLTNHFKIYASAPSSRRYTGHLP